MPGPCSLAAMMTSRFATRLPFDPTRKRPVARDGRINLRFSASALMGAVMRGRCKIPLFTIPLVALASLPALASAQSLGDWSLPEPEKTSSPRAEGPVDAQNPIVRPATPEPSPAPAPIPTITPLPVPPESTIATPAGAPPARPTSAPRPAARPGASQTVPAPSASSATITPEPLPGPTPLPEQSPLAQDRAPPAPAAHTGWPLWWWALPALVAAIGAGLFLFRRRRREAALEWDEMAGPESTPDAGTPDLPPEAEPQVAPSPPRAQPLPLPAFPPAAPTAIQDDISLTLEPGTMRLSLFYATLQYRLAVTAASPRPPLKVMGDLISAHASLTREEQLAPQPDSLPVLHSLPGLLPGEKIELKGEIQLPLTAIRALRQGGGAFLVPLVRFCLIAEDGTALRRVFTVGIPGNGAGLAPLRIDAGPRNFEPLAAGEVEAARQFPLEAGSFALDPQRVAG